MEKREALGKSFIDDGGSAGVRGHALVILLCNLISLYFILLYVLLLF